MNAFLLTRIKAQKTIISYINDAGQVVEITNIKYGELSDNNFYTVNGNGVFNPFN